MKKVYHLSHIDLDGYSAQLVTSKCFSNITFYNSNYGEEIDERIEQIIDCINKDEQSLILISDLNLTLAQCKKLDEFAKYKTEIELLLLDHHISGEKCAELYEWYNLDASRCATKIVYDYFSPIHDIVELEEFVNVVNSVDIWISDSPYFELGKVLSSFIDGCREVNKIQFPKQNASYIRAILTQTLKYINDSTSSHIILDENIHKIKKDFFTQEENNTLSNLVSKYLVDLLTLNKNDFTLNYKEYKGILTFSILSSSIVGNDFLVANPDYHFFINVTGRKTISLRANGKIDVSLMAKELFGGGGHKNASGGKLKEFKSSFVYEKIFVQIQNIML